MGLDINLYAVVTEEKCVFESYATHNLTEMADAAGLYKAIWRPEELSITTAGQLVPILEIGLKLLLNDPSHFKKFNPKNGWGSYENLVALVTEYLVAARNNPTATIRVSR